jgi:hypothetical protein
MVSKRKKYRRGENLVGQVRKLLAGKWSEKRCEDLAGDLDILLGDLCTRWGFCNRLTGTGLVRNHDYLTLGSFATAVLIAEGMNPDLQISWHRKIREVFRRRYGEAFHRAALPADNRHDGASSAARFAYPLTVFMPLPPSSRQRHVAAESNPIRQSGYAD